MCCCKQWMTYIWFAGSMTMPIVASIYPSDYCYIRSLSTCFAAFDHRHSFGSRYCIGSDRDSQSSSMAPLSYCWSSSICPGVICRTRSPSDETTEIQVSACCQQWSSSWAWWLSMYCLHLLSSFVPAQDARNLSICSWIWIADVSGVAAVAAVAAVHSFVRFSMLIVTYGTLDSHGVSWAIASLLLVIHSNHWYHDCLSLLDDSNSHCYYDCYIREIDDCCYLIDGSGFAVADNSKNSHDWVSCSQRTDSFSVW